MSNLTWIDQNLLIKTFEKMSLNLDDWLKPSDEPNEANNDVDPDEDPITNSLSAADLQLPDLGLPDIKWWVDLEFLDLASGPPANINSSQNKNKNTNTTVSSLQNSFSNPAKNADENKEKKASVPGAKNPDTSLDR